MNRGLPPPPPWLQEPSWGCYGDGSTRDQPGPRPVLTSDSGRGREEAGTHSGHVVCRALQLGALPWPRGQGRSQPPQSRWRLFHVRHLCPGLEVSFLLTTDYGGLFVPQEKRDVFFLLMCGAVSLRRQNHARYLVGADHLIGEWMDKCPQRKGK